MPPNQKHMGPAHRAVLDLLAQQGAAGATDAEGAQATHMTRTGYAQRRVWLAARGYVIAATDAKGKPVQRPGASKRDGYVWVLAKGGPCCKT